MNSLKSTCVVLVLAGVLYGVYVTLNTPQPSAHDPAHAHIQPPTIDFGPASQSPALTHHHAPSPNNSRLPPLVSEPHVSLPPTQPPPFNSPPPSANVPATFTAPDVTPPAPQPGNYTTPPVANYTAPAHSAPPSQNAELPPAFTPPAFTPPATDPDAPAPPGYTSTTAPAESHAAPAPAGATSPTLEAYKLKRAFQAVELHMQDGKLRNALEELSPFANNPHLPADDRRAVLNWLDALAAKVIYGPEHYLAEPYRVSENGQSLFDVANRYKLPVQLLQNINSQAVRDPSVLVRGTELKVIPGPFRAEINLAAGELTLFVGKLYAGRFAFTIGDERPLAGTYQVRQKDLARTYIGRDGRQIAAGDPANPYGNIWIDLGANACLHGSGTSSGLGCLSFSPQDAQDLYSILSVTSEVVIK